MGYERFDGNAYRSYAKSTRLESLSREEVFTSRHMPPGLDPAKIVLRESCDSAANPTSTPVIFGLDVTGSMGFIAEAIAKRGLEPLMRSIYDQKPITDPHIMFMGIGDVRAWDKAPLQVSQFEAGALPLIEQLRTLYLEGNGGGNGQESYDLPWYFAATRTKIDSLEKRNTKGYLFTIGDEPPPHSPLTADQLYRIFQNRDMPSFGSVEDVLKEAQKSYKVFHIIVEEGDYARRFGDNVRSVWHDLLGPNTILMSDHSKLSEIVLATIKIAEGASITEVIESADNQDVLRHAFKYALAQD